MSDMRRWNVNSLGTPKALKLKVKLPQKPTPHRTSERCVPSQLSTAEKTVQISKSGLSGLSKANEDMAPVNSETNWYEDYLSIPNQFIFLKTDPLQFDSQYEKASKEPKVNFQNESHTDFWQNGEFCGLESPVGASTSFAKIKTIKKIDSYTIADFGRTDCLDSELIPIGCIKVEDPSQKPAHKRTTSTTSSRNSSDAPLKHRILDILETKQSRRTTESYMKKHSLRGFLSSQQALSKEGYYEVLAHEHMDRSRCEEASRLISRSSRTIGGLEREE